MSTIRIQQQTGDSWSTVMGVTYKQIGESFTPSASFELTQIKVLLQWVWGDTPPATESFMVCSVYHASSDLPSGDPIATSNNQISTNDIEQADGGGSPNYTSAFFTFDAGINLMKSVDYVFMVYPTSLWDTSGHSLGSLTNSAGGYDSGKMVRKTVTIYSSSTYDMHFEIWGDDYTLSPLPTFFRP